VIVMKKIMKEEKNMLWKQDMKKSKRRRRGGRRKEHGREDMNPGFSDRPRAGRPGFDLRQGQGIFFFLLHSVQTGSRAQRAAYPMGTGGSFPWGKAARA
jgi:hypothetical protein